MQGCVRGDIIAYFFSLSFPLSLWSSSSFHLYFHPLRVHNISLVVVCVSRLGNASLWPLTPPLLWALVFVWIAYPQRWGVIMGLRRVFSTKCNPPPSLFCPLISLLGPTVHIYSTILSLPHSHCTFLNTPGIIRADPPGRGCGMGKMIYDP